jgi:hypothetical protein
MENGNTLSLAVMGENRIGMESWMHLVVWIKPVAKKTARKETRKPAYAGQEYELRSFGAHASSPRI